MLKYKDLTLKARLCEMDAFEQKLLELGAKYEGEDYQQDYYFKITNGKLKFRKGTIGTLITHYERILVNNMELTIVYLYKVNPTDLKIQHLYASNELIGETQKNRKLYQLHNMTVHIDELSNGERYIEIEAMDFDDSHILNHRIITAPFV